ncbi:protein SAR DEFICIENT 1-like isoform X2 [Cicer arietinum]|uniref:Protein SAR DEFICIENT 1-like isoform X2 n=1 Tax=Cicer arietinum TaxID=3827 RepID=A0A1S2YDW7_CICAR|nr:protein SAR DEFICIENT 1-like isoform X2 [Cicer arietinum]
MAAKRSFDDSDQDKHKPNDKRMRSSTTRPSFASVIGEVVMVKNMQNLFSGLEPLLRRVVNEEVERAMRRCCPTRTITRSPSLRLQAMEQASSFEFMFRKKLSLPIFTGSRILDIDGNPIHVILVDKSNGEIVPTSLPQPIKIEIVVLDGDFPPSEKESSWSSEEFNSNIVKERTGKRPLLTGELNITMRDGIAPIGDIEFTDNSSWIRSRKFRVAVRIAHGTNLNVRIREGITEPFIVKDHRGELYKKHHPPMLKDEVWRLEKIGKDGAFHKKLTKEGITTVQEFLKLSVVDPHRLRKILGLGMSEKMWDVTIKHAKTCIMGDKLYVYRGPHFTIYLNAICQMVKAFINGQPLLNRDLSNRSYIEKLVTEAYVRWDDLEEIDQVFSDNVALLTQGETLDQFPNNNQLPSVIRYDQNDYFGDKCIGTGNYVANHSNNNAQTGCIEWSPFATSPFVNGIPYSFSDSQSDGGDLTPSSSGPMIDDGVSRWR